jgi:hypothetical protein
VSTTVLKQGDDLWIIKGDTRPIKDVLSAAGARWQPQRVRWEYTGETLPDAIQAALDGRNVLPIADPPKPEPIEREPDWDKLILVLDDMRAVLRGWQTRDEMTAWVQELVTNATAPAESIRFYSVVVPKKVATRKKLLKALIDADAIGIAQYNTSATRWSVLWSTGVVEIMDVDDLELASAERCAKLLPVVEGATVLRASSKRASRGKALRLKPSGKWEVEFNGGTRVSEWAKAMIVLAHPVERLYEVKEIRVVGVQAWNVVPVGSDEIVMTDIAEQREAEELVQIFNTHGIRDIEHAKQVAEAWNLHRIKPNGDVLDYLLQGVIGTIRDRSILAAVLHEDDEPAPIPVKGIQGEMWWIDEDDTIFRDDEPVPDHFAVLRGPFGSRDEAERTLAHVV